MLYSQYQFIRQTLAPWTQAAQGAAKALNEGIWQYHPASSFIAGSLEAYSRVWQNYKKPRFGIEYIEAKGKYGSGRQANKQKTIPVVEQVVAKTPFMELRRFRTVENSSKQRKNKTVILVVAPMSGHHATLLRDTVRELVGGHTVYITDWIDAKDVPLEEGEFSLDSYVQQLDWVMEAISEQPILGCEVKDLHILAVCQPVVPVLAGMSLRAQNGKSTAASMILMGGPIDARLSPTGPNLLATGKGIEWFENNLIHRVPHGNAGAGRLVYPGFLQHMGFMAMNPGKHAQSHWEFLRDVWAGDDAAAQKHRDFYDEYNAVADLHAPYYLQTVRSVFQDFDLPRGKMKINAQIVKPAAIRTTALLTIEGARDDIAGIGQTAAALELCSGIPLKNKHHMMADAGHYGLFSGRRWRTQVCPAIEKFIAQHST